MLNFILGIIFVCIIVPIMDEIGRLFCSIIEIFKVKCHLKITEINNKAAQVGKSTTHPIGFQARSPDEDK